MINVSMGIDELLWLQRYLPGTIQRIHSRVGWAVMVGNEQAEVRYTQEELAAKRLLDAVNHAVKQAVVNQPEGSA